MTWSSGSAVFNRFLQSVLGECQTTTPHQIPSGYTGLMKDVTKVALYGNAGTPNKNDTLANSAYGAGQWVSGNQVYDTNWPATGQTLAGMSLASTSGLVTFDATDTASSGSVTLANVYGCMLYDDTIAAGTGGVADQGICYNFFGGAQSVTAGTFTVVWNASGIFTISM